MTDSACTHNSIRIASNLGAQAFFDSDPNSEFIPENPQDWGTPEFVAWADAYELERTAYMDNLYESRHERMMEKIIEDEPQDKG